MASKIETTLREATGIKPKSGEDTQEFYKRLIAAVQELPEDVWEKLDTKAQKWVNDGAKAANKQEDIQDFPDAEANQEDDEVTTKTKTAKKGGDKTEKTDAKKAPATTKKAADDKTEKKPAAKKEAKAEKTAKKPKGSGLETTIKNLIIKKPAITSDELVEKLEAKSVKASRFTVVAIRAGFRHSIKVLQEAGLIKGQLEL
jgi:hypothetical protein